MAAHTHTHTHTHTRTRTHTHTQSLVTPLGALFWSLFQYDECGHFFWGPHADSLTYFSIGGIAMMVPAIFFYNIKYTVHTQSNRRVKDVWIIIVIMPL